MSKTYRSSKSQGSGKGWLWFAAALVLVAAAAYVGGQSYGAKRGILKEKAGAAAYEAEPNPDAENVSDEYEPKWDEDSPSNYADDVSLE